MSDTIFFLKSLKINARFAVQKQQKQKQTLCTTSWAALNAVFEGPRIEVSGKKEVRAMLIK